MEEFSLGVNERIKNETLRLDAKIDLATTNFKILGTNLTEELQKQEIHASKSWVSPSKLLQPRFLTVMIFQKLLEQLNTDIQNVSAKALSNELVSQANKNDIIKLKSDVEQLKLPSTNATAKL